jgi:hypothetical protein
VLVAVIVTVLGVGKVAGAVYIPFTSIVPTVALPPAIEFTDQVTLLLVEPSLVAPLLALLLLEVLRRRPSLLILRPPSAPLFVVPPPFVELLVVLLEVLVLVMLVPEVSPVIALLMVAANASFAPARIVAVAGVTVTPVVLPSGGSVEPSLPRFVPRPEQPLRHNMRSTACALQIRFTDMPPK